MTKQKNIAVIGAGVIGLSTVLCLQKEFPSASVSLYADKFNEDTLSAGAGGIFRPELNIDEDFERLSKWCEDSFSHFLELARSPEASKAGTQLVSGYHLSSNPLQIQNPLLLKLLPEYRELQEKELKMFPRHYKYGMFYTTIITDCRYYLPWMKSKFQEANGNIVPKYIINICEIAENHDVVVNCSGLGAKQLLKDKMLIPVRGQTIKRAEIAWDWVGLRPYRPSVRIDANFIPCNGNYKMVVNNYGHGGHGVALSWGTALEATQLVKKFFVEKNFVAKL
ncbi:D-aspartate oxidase-like isoform X3 [Stegodyphus dumicola]|uniref:D-aspartate oxidase-like isoform X3 n=1 Tax=Stegodyphus dumicola TaxID=202533 RepID=UPI0015AECA57|nr:D-aspartate oxidase-like isoform X3 [Stegodyphus dumicola]